MDLIFIKKILKKDRDSEDFLEILKFFNYNTIMIPILTTP